MDLLLSFISGFDYDWDFLSPITIAIFTADAIKIKDKAYRFGNINHVDVILFCVAPLFI